jgi:UDP-2,3-diacylglucosamine pyrophosphatase LpxH
MEYFQWPIERTPVSATFVSDLHLFSNRSSYGVHRESIERSIDEAEMCVWGGDLFDFRWTRLGDDRATVVESTRWLRDWLERYPAKQFVFLRGNHDANAAFQASLCQLASEYANFYCELDAVRVGDTLMLHGDLLEGAGTRASLATYRDSWRHKPIAGRVQNHIYDVAVLARLHKAAAMSAHRHRATCTRLWRSISSELGGEIAGVQRVVFGHTHRQIRGLKFARTQFFNPGAAVRHVKFAPVNLHFPRG